jgi:hypothetical protein
LPTTSHSPSEKAPPTASTSWTGLAADVFSFPVMCMFLQKKVDNWFPRDALGFMQQKHITGRLFSWGASADISSFMRRQ